MLKAMVLRNIKLYFKDKGMFFTSLITPAILLVLYATFLGSVYRDSFTANLPDGFSLSQKLIDGAVGHCAAGAFRHSAFVADPLFPQHPGTDIRSGNTGQRRLRLSLRCIYAHFQLW